MKLSLYIIITMAITRMLVACSPTVKVEAPDKPVEINLNVNVEHHIKVEVEKDVKKAISKNPEIF